LAAFSLAGCSLTWAQQQPVEVKRSAEKTLYGGKIFYIHTVLKGQTLYSISRVYGVTQEEIYRANPTLVPGELKEGQALRIPEKATTVAPAYPENRESYREHAVRKGQTVYSLARKYRVTEALIYKHNPWAQNGIQPGQTLWIPRETDGWDQNEELASQRGVFYYTVKEKDTLYSIARQYGTSVESIVEANPVLLGGLKAGQVLAIRVVAEEDADQSAEADTNLVGIIPCEPADGSETYDVALILPFFARFSLEEALMPVDSLMEAGTYEPVYKQTGLRGRSFAEFYEGFLLALDSVKNAGLSVRLRVYDSERDSLNVKKIVRELSSIRPDLIVGPVYSSDVAIASRLARYLQVPLVSPLSTRMNLAGNPFVFQVVPSKMTELETLASHLNAMPSGRVILLSAADSLSINQSRRFRQVIDSFPGGFTWPVSVFKLNDSILTRLNKILDQHQPNLVVVFSESEPDVSRLVSRLYMMSQIYPITLFGRPSWHQWKTIDLNYFHNLHLHLVMPFHADFGDTDVRHFMHKFRKTFGYEPYEVSPTGYNFSMLGYDIGMYFLSALNGYGSDFAPCLESIGYRPMLSGFQFRQIHGGGYVNGHAQMIRYNPDYTISRLKNPGD